LKKKILIKYWNKFYSRNSIKKESTFAKFTQKKIKLKKANVLDVGCGNGRDAFFFAKKNHVVLGIDISKEVIQKNSKKKNRNLEFKKFDIEKDMLKKKFDVIYCRFFLHTINQILEKKLITLIKKVKNERTMVFFEFRNFKDKIFGNFKAKDHNKVIEFEKGHFRRIIDPKIFKKKFLSQTKSKFIYQKSGINLSVVKNDNPNLTRMIFKFNDKSK
jgi:tellurite methyltransferase